MYARYDNITVYGDEFQMSVKSYLENLWRKSHSNMHFCLWYEDQMIWLIIQKISYSCLWRHKYYALIFLSVLVNIWQWCTELNPPLSFASQCSDHVIGECVFPKFNFNFLNQSNYTFSHVSEAYSTKTYHQYQFFLNGLGKCCLQNILSDCGYCLRETVYLVLDLMM